ncbi:MAG TPA: DNA-binding response regulator [Dehalococcoidia bacterium]|nr:DNA-binding response regulator [Dehalococcoidia bacterium]
MKILIIEDSPDIQEAISLCFEIHWSEAQVLTVGLGEEGIAKTGSESPDIVILDLGLPDIDGFKVLKEIRTFSDVPVIILTVRGEEIDKVRGLELGADDYIVKPFSHMELLARVKAVLRRSHMTELKQDEKIVLNPQLSIDFVSRTILKESKKIKLTPTEFNLLRYLARNEGKVLTHHTLLSKVWGEEYTDSSDYLKVYIQRLRDKLEIDPANPEILISERGVGYKFVKSPH